MAKRKNSTALFEVMRAAQQKAMERQGISLQSGTAMNGAAVGGAPTQPAAPLSSKPPTSLLVADKASPATDGAHLTARSYAPPAGQSQLKPLGTPAIITVTRKWLSTLLEKKPRSQTDTGAPAETTLDPSDPTAGMTAQALMSRGSRHVGVGRTAGEGPSFNATVDPNPEQVFVDESDEPDESPSPARSIRTDPPSARPAGAAPYAQSEHGGSASGNQVAIDRDRQQVTVKVRFQTVAIGVVATLVVVGLAYIAGKKTGAPARVATSNEIKTGPIQPGVLDPRGAKSGVVAGEARTAAERIPGASASVSPPVNGSLSVRSGDGMFVDSPVVNGLAKRDSKLNYCVIESYSPTQQQWALDVRDFLNSAGIPCTIEIGRPNLSTRSGDYLIVGTRGFAPRYGNTAPYKAYLEAIDQVSLSFPDKSKFRQPQMMMVKWVDE